LDDLADRGRLDETLGVVLTEFGRTPKWTGTGRDHYPLCYSAPRAGAGVAGGPRAGVPDPPAPLPRDRPPAPAYVHATIFHALGIPLDTQLIDNQGRKLSLTDGTPLPLF